MLQSTHDFQCARARVIGALIGGLCGILWAGAASAIEWRATHGVNVTQYQQFVAEIGKAGMRLDYVQGYDAGGTPQFAAIAVKDGLAFGARTLCATRITPCATRSSRP